MYRPAISPFSAIILRAGVGVLLLGGILLHAGLSVWAVEPPDQELDCSVYRTEEFGITLGFKFGTFFLSAGPEVTFSQQAGIAWDRVVQGLIARYVELCTRYNGGLVTPAEYQTRLMEIERLHANAQAVEGEMVRETQKRAEAGSRALEEALAERRGHRTTRVPTKTQRALLQSLQHLDERIAPP